MKAKRECVDYVRDILWSNLLPVAEACRGAKSLSAKAECPPFFKPGNTYLDRPADIRRETKKRVFAA